MGSPQIFDKNQIGKEARISIRGQRSRCENAKASDYKYYGGKGIKVIYTSEIFYKWFKNERAKIPLNIKVNVDRINHSKNYTLKNIRLITKKDNVIESNTRRAKVSIKGILFCRDIGMKQWQIAVVFGVTQANISSRLNKKYKRNKK